jgi:hypothetical protein
MPETSTKIINKVIIRSPEKKIVNKKAPPPRRAAGRGVYLVFEKPLRATKETR